MLERSFYPGAHILVYTRSLHLYVFIQGYGGALSRHMSLLVCLEVCRRICGLCAYPVQTGLYAMCFGPMCHMIASSASDIYMIEFEMCLRQFDFLYTRKPAVCDSDLMSVFGCPTRALVTAYGVGS